MAPDQRKYSIQLLIDEPVSLLVLLAGVLETLRQLHHRIPTAVNCLPNRRTSENGGPSEEPVEVPGDSPECPDSRTLPRGSFHENQYGYSAPRR